MKYFNTLFLYMLMCAAFLGIHQVAYTQYTEAGGWQIGFGAGYTNYLGDLSNYRIRGLKDVDKLYRFADYNKYYTDKPSVSVMVHKTITPTLGLLLQANTLTFSGSDRYRNKNGSFDTSSGNYARALNFRTSLQDAGLALTFKTNNGKFLPERAFFYPSFFVGMGVSRFTVTGDLYDQDNARYNYKLPGDIQDGTFETNLRDRRTETSNKYGNIVPYIDLGLGLNFRVSDQVGLSVQSDIKYSGSDYLDDVSGIYKPAYPNPEEQYAAKPGYNLVDPVSRQRGDNNSTRDVYINNRVILSIGLTKRKVQKPFVPPTVYSLSMPYRPKSEPAPATKNEQAYRDFLQAVKADSMRMLARMNDSLMRVIDTAAIRQPAATPQNDSVKRELQTINQELKEIKSLLKDQQVRPRYQQLQYQADSLRSLQNKISSQRIISREDNLRMRIYQLQADSVGHEMEKLRQRTGSDTVNVPAPEKYISLQAAQPLTTTKAYSEPVIQVSGQQEIDSLQSRLNELEERIIQKNRADSTAYNQARQDAEKTMAANRAADSVAVNRNINQLEDRLTVSNDSVSYLKRQLLHATDSATYYNRLALSGGSDTAATDNKKTKWYRRMFLSRKTIDKEEAAEKSRLEAQQRYYQQQANRTNQQVDELERRNKALSDQYEELVSERNTRRREDILVQTSPPTVIYQDDANRSRGFSNVEYNELLALRNEINRLKSQVASANQRSYNDVPVVRPPVVEVPIQQPAVTVPAPVAVQQPVAPVTDTAGIGLLRTDLEQLRRQLDSMKNIQPVVTTREVVTSQKFDVKSFPVVSVYFRSGSAVLTNDQIRKITPFAQVAAKNPDANMLLKAFTDPTGNPAVNQAIAKKRAEYVKNILTSTFNFPASRIAADEPAVGETTKTGKPNPLDRRVDLEFIR